MSGLFDDTIAAIATAPGRGAIALLRLAGPTALAILHRLCPALDGVDPAPRSPRLLAINHPDTHERLDHALVTWFPSPGSFTGEDTVELSTHGGLLTPQLVLDALVAAGARSALPGEFTRRALLNGKIDLLQAEAIGDLIDGSSPALHRAAVHQLERGLSARIEMLRRGLLRLEALIAYSIDFPDEDEPPIPPERIDAAAAEVEASIAEMLASAPEGELLREGALVALAGRPNSGKSSLFNALLGRDRAIVTDIPGTTRDALEAAVTMDGYPFLLVDTAGLRETVDPVERIGIEVARRYLATAAVVILCAEAGRPLKDDERRFAEEIGSRRLLLARTKADLPHGEASGRDAVGEVVEVSAVTGAGLDALRGALLRRSFGGLLSAPAEAPLVTRRRHSRALRRAGGEVDVFRRAVRDDVPMELAATHLRAAAVALEEIIGGVSTEDLLDELFGAFCVGK